MADQAKIARMQEIVNRGLVSQLPQEKQAIIGEAIKRGILTQPSAPEEKPMSFGEFVEPIATIGSAAIAEPVAGVAGIVQSLNPFAEEGAGARAVEATREALTYQPESDQAKQVLGEVGGLVEKPAQVVEEAVTGAGDWALEMWGSPTIATAIVSAPVAIAELFGLKGLRSIRKGTRLIDANGRPTETLAKHLDKSGLDYDALKPEVREAIPEFADPKLIPAGELKANTAETVKKQIMAGGQEDALAGLKLQGGKVVADKAANEVIKQGFRPGLVQSVKTANKATKHKMLKMSRIMRRIKKSERAGLDVRPTDVVGDSVVERVSFIRDRADVARKQLNNIAENRLKGKYVDFEPVKRSVVDSLEALDVGFEVDVRTGKLKPTFEGSLVSADRSSQRAIKDLVNLMQESAKPDALSMHKLKRKIDNLIDYKKKSKDGLSAEGERTLKNARRQINESLRATNKDYAKVNDILSQSIDALEDLDKASGTIDIFGKGSKSAIGTKMRALLSNQQGRVNLENALATIEDVTKNLGGKFDDDIKSLVMFADALDDKFGTVAKTSFAGQVEQGAKQAARSVRTKEGLIDAGIGKVASGADKLRGINDFNAFESLEKLLQ
jgi:hypothetical protein